jgi:aryl-alcohol dehydrogenase-like predicted oxidoreductase
MKLAIGTVQFGLEYGVSNSAGRTPANEAGRILSRARSAGVDTLDTAIAYGDSEKVLGEIGLNGWQVISKVPSLPDGANAQEWISTNLRQSLSSLGLEKLDGLLLHNADDLLKSQSDSVIAGLQQAKSEGLVKKIGYSIYNPDNLLELTHRLKPDLVQVPVNVLDQRIVTSGWLGRLAEMGVEVHVRSVFLQGLLLMPPANRPAYFSRWQELWQRWDSHIVSQNTSPLAACLGYVKSLPDVARIVVGVDNLKHLEQLLSAWEVSRPLGAENFSCTDRNLIEPVNWTLQ